MYNKGYALGQQTAGNLFAADNMAVLMFGQPTLVGGVYGASAYRSSGGYISTDTITLASLYFAYGYYNGVGTKSTPLRIVIGTSNSGLDNSTWTSASIYNHGHAWMSMVNNIDYNINYFGWSSKIVAYGGMDMEPAFAYPSNTLQWKSGYTAGAYIPLISFGSLDGCPTSGTTKNPATCSHSWTQESLYNFEHTSLTYPLPQVYTTNGTQAQQWQQLSLYSYLAHGSSIWLIGPMSQYAAWNQKCAPTPSAPGCPGANNTPVQAWSQLWSSLNGDSRTAQNFNWSTDISWQ